MAQGLRETPDCINIDHWIMCAVKHQHRTIGPVNLLAPIACDVIGIGLKSTVSLCNGKTVTSHYGAVSYTHLTLPTTPYV